MGGANCFEECVIRPCYHAFCKEGSGGSVMVIPGFHETPELKQNMQLIEKKFDATFH